MRTTTCPDNPQSARSGSLEQGRLQAAWQAAGPPLLFGVRLWASVCLALYVAYWLELDNPFWAGITAGLVCQPQVGASLRKGWFRMIGTFTGAIAIVLMTACFPQDRVLFLLSLVLWGTASAFFATFLRNYASYSAALAGYTALIIARDQLGATGGLDGLAFRLAMIRMTEISIGIVSAGIVLAGTDLGGARRHLASLLADLTVGITTHFAGALSPTTPELSDTRPVRREYIRRIVALDPIIDTTTGESTQIRYHSPVLRRAVDGLFATLSGWRAVGNHLVRLPHDQARAEAAVVLRRIPPALLRLLQQNDSALATDEPAELSRSCETAARQLVALPADTPSQRLLADKTADVLTGVSDAIAGLALLSADTIRPGPFRREVFHLRVADWLPALINAGRACLTISTVTAFWIVTAWPNGANAIVWAAIVVTVYSPQADQAYRTAMGNVMGTVIAAMFAAAMAFAVLPRVATFAGFAVVLGLYMIPAGTLAALPWQRAVFGAMSAWFIPLLAPTNPMNYDTQQFYNTTSALLTGIIAGAVSFRLIPPLSPECRTRRLLALTLRDLRSLAMRGSFNDWEGHIYGRLAGLPMDATPTQHAEVLAALSLGTEIIRLCPVVRRLNTDLELDDALAAIAAGKSAMALPHLRRLDETLARYSLTEPEALRARGSILVITEVLGQHPDYFDREH